MPGPLSYICQEDLSRCVACRRRRPVSCAGVWGVARCSGHPDLTTSGSLETGALRP